MPKASRLSCGAVVCLQWRWLLEGQEVQSQSQRTNFGRHRSKARSSQELLLARKECKKDSQHIGDVFSPLQAAAAQGAAPCPQGRLSHGPHRRDPFAHLFQVSASWRGRPRRCPVVPGASLRFLLGAVTRRPRDSARRKRRKRKRTKRKGTRSGPFVVAWSVGAVLCCGLGRPGMPSVVLLVVL